MADTLPSFVLRGHAAEVTSVAFHAHSGAMISSATDGQLRVWDLPTRRCTGTAVAHGRGVGVLSAQFWRDRIVTCAHLVMSSHCRVKTTRLFDFQFLN